MTDTPQIFGTKEVALKDGTSVLLRPMVSSDEEALYQFFHALPDESLIFIRHDVRERSLFEKWARNLDYTRVFPLLALVGGRIVADLTLHRVPHGWKRHVGRIRAVVSPDYTNKGLATLMVNELVALSAEFGLEKLWAEIPLDSTGGIQSCRNAGFTCKAVIEGLVKDARDQNRDVIIMVCDIGAYFDRRWCARKDDKKE